MLYQKMWRVGIDLGGRIFADSLLNFGMRRSREAAKECSPRRKAWVLHNENSNQPRRGERKATTHTPVDRRHSIYNAPEIQKQILMRTYMSRLFFRVRLGIAF